MVTIVPQVTNWSVTPQNGQVNYFTLMNTWLFESTSVIASLNTAINKINEAGEDINNIGANAINAITFDNIAQLKLNSNIGRVDVLGYYTKGDGGGGTFYWDSASTEADNGGTIIQATGITTGRWKRVYSGAVNVKWFGAKSDWNGTTGTDNTTIFAAAVAYLNSINGGELLIPSGKYKGKLIIKHSNIKVKGYGAEIGYMTGTTLRVQATNGTSNLAPFLGFTGTIPNNLAAGASFYSISSATKGSVYINLTDASGISVGDNIIVISKEVASGSTTATNFIPYFHQIVKVVSVVGNTIGLNESLEKSIASIDPYSFAIKWDFVENITVEGLIVNNLVGGSYCVDFGGAINLNLKDVVFNPQSSWGAFATCRKVTFDNCIVNDTYNGFSNGRMCDEITVHNCTVKPTDNDIQTAQNYFYFCEENTKRLRIDKCVGVNAGVWFYIGSEYTDIQITNSTFNVYKSGSSAFRLATFETGSNIYCSNSTFVSNGGSSSNPWDLVPNGTIAIAYLNGFVTLDSCRVIQNGTGVTFANQRYATNNLRIYNSEQSALKIVGNVISATDTNGNINLTPNGTGLVVINKSNKTAGISTVGGQSGQFVNSSISAKSDDTGTARAAFVVNGVLNNTAYSSGIDRVNTTHSAWNLLGSVHSSANESQSSFQLRHTTAAGVESVRWAVEANGNFRPGADNTLSAGTATYRWSTIYAGTGTINTSDDREKIYIDITDTEKKVAVELKANMKKFKFNNSIEEKGENKARIHFGASAQTVKSIFEKYELNAFDYSILCYDEWEEQEEIKNENGDIIQEYRPYGNRYGLRYEELLCFIIGCI